MLIRDTSMDRRLQIPFMPNSPEDNKPMVTEEGYPGIEKKHLIFGVSALLAFAAIHQLLIVFEAGCRQRAGSGDERKDWDRA